MGLFESPSPLKIELNILYAVIKGTPIKQIVRYSRAPEAASIGVDITETIEFTNKSSKTVAAAETTAKSVTVLPMETETPSLFSAPT